MSEMVSGAGDSDYDAMYLLSLKELRKKRQKNGPSGILRAMVACTAKMPVVECK
jgi:hypothetical protein